jgi:hypothetical protein
MTHPHNPTLNPGANRSFFMLNTLTLLTSLTPLEGGAPFNRPQIQA